MANDTDTTTPTDDRQARLNAILAEAKANAETVAAAIAESKPGRTAGPQWSPDAWVIDQIEVATMSPGLPLDIGMWLYSDRAKLKKYCEATFQTAGSSTFAWDFKMARNDASFRPGVNKSDGKKNPQNDYGRYFAIAKPRDAVGNTIARGNDSATPVGAPDPETADVKAADDAANEKARAEAKATAAAEKAAAKVAKSPETTPESPDTSATVVAA